MPKAGKSILVVDDNSALRTVMSIILSEAGYQVRVAADGFAALMEIRREIPELLLSDLNMPSMSGFELLSVVRRRFPEIQVIAMSGAFAGSDIPPGVAADAFYRKGGGDIAVLMCIIDNLLEPEQPIRRRSAVPVWLPATSPWTLKDAPMVLTCQECLRVFPQHARAEFSTHEAHCPHCCSTVRFALVQPMSETDLTGLALTSF